MPAIIKIHQRIIKIQPNQPKSPNPKFIILLVEFLLKGDDHPPVIICIIGMKPAPCEGIATEVSSTPPAGRQALKRFPMAMCVCSSFFSPII